MSEQVTGPTLRAMFTLRLPSSRELVCLALLLSGCGDVDDNDDNDTGTVEILSCSALPDACGEVDMSDAWLGEGYDEGATCALERLRDVAGNVSDAAPSVLRTGTDLVLDSPDMRYLVLRADGTVLLQQSGNMNGGDSYTLPVESCTLAPASYFEGCLDSPDSDCLEFKNWYTGCADAETFTCPG